MALGLISAGKDTWNRTFEIKELQTHVESSLKVLTSLKGEVKGTPFFAHRF